MGAIQSVQVGMGEPVLILAFVVIVIGGIGSIKGALIGALFFGAFYYLRLVYIIYFMERETKLDGRMPFTHLCILFVASRIAPLVGGGHV